jgi:hypothetical protein
MMQRFLKTVLALLCCACYATAFAPMQGQASIHSQGQAATQTKTALHAAELDLATVALVAGQENYGLAVVLLGESIWSFSGAPGVDHGLKTLVPAAVAAAILVIVSGPMVTSGDAASVATGLWVATVVSVAMGGTYLARCLAPFSPTSKEIPAFGVLVAVAGFFSFSQNLVVDGFVTLPSITLPSLPSLPTIQLPF